MHTATTGCEFSESLIDAMYSGGTPRTPELFHQLAIHLHSTNVLRDYRNCISVAQSARTDDASVPISNDRCHVRDACGRQVTPCSNLRKAADVCEQV